MKKFFVWVAMILLVNAMILSGCAAPSPTPTPTPTPLPKVIGCTTYGVGSGGHAAVMALGESIKQSTGISVMAIPFGSDMARVLPMATGRCAMGLTGPSETYTAGYGLYPFSDEEGNHVAYTSF